MMMTEVGGVGREREEGGRGDDNDDDKEKEERGKHCYSPQFIDETTEAQTAYLKVKSLVFLPLCSLNRQCPGPFSLQISSEP